jgi:hypothetical protein
VKQILIEEFPNIYIAREVEAEGGGGEKKEAKLRKRKINVSTTYFSKLKSIGN